MTLSAHIRRTAAATAFALCALALAAPVSGAEPTSSASAGDGFFAKVAWSERIAPFVNRVGYVYVSEEQGTRSGYYVYYSIHQSGADPIIGFGVVGREAVQRRGGRVVLDVDTTNVKGFTRVNSTGGRLRVSWQAVGSTLTEVDGRSVERIGDAVIHERSGFWSEVVAEASGSVLTVGISKQQTARMGIQSGGASVVHFAPRSDD